MLSIRRRRASLSLRRPVLPNSSASAGFRQKPTPIPRTWGNLAWMIFFFSVGPHPKYAMGASQFAVDGRDRLCSRLIYLGIKILNAICRGSPGRSSSCRQVDRGRRRQPCRRASLSLLPAVMIGGTTGISARSTKHYGRHKLFVVLAFILFGIG